MTAASAPAAAQPAVDVLTDKVAVVLQDRPVVGMTAWFSEALRATLGSERGWQIVTPRECRLSLPTGTALTGPPTRWVVQDPGCGYYDGRSGAVLRRRDGAFVAAGDPEDTGTGRPCLLGTGSSAVFPPALLRSPSRSWFCNY
ncbi:DUF6177 family protein [Streptomyces andamanensis]|uniref:DUF6177 family protein n=1 Tax=Streptomyces andamanensis TaxID=1565035 RepID=A0ABV8TBI3_9ACTN